MRRASVLLAPLFLCLTVTTALASFHLMVIQEVFFGPYPDCQDPGLTADQRGQYVMLRMTSSGQTLVGNTFVRVEDADGNLLGRFGTFTATVANSGPACGGYPNCPAIIQGTQAADNLFTFSFDKDVDGQASRVALPLSGGRVCFIGAAGSNVVDCVASGNFDCTRSGSCALPNGPRTSAPADSSANTCDLNFGAPVAPGGVSFGQALVRTSFNCVSKENSTQFTVGLPHPVNNAGANSNTDADIDGLIDVLDCADADVARGWPTPDVRNLRFNAATTFSWDSQGSCGAGVTYDVIKGDLQSLPDFSLATCHDPNLAVASSGDAGVPGSPGAGFYYLVRADQGVSLCAGSYGLGTSAADGACP